MADATMPTTHADAWNILRHSLAFWDVDCKNLDPHSHAQWIIDRILQFGGWDDWVALFRIYTPDQIRAALNARRVPDYIREFWSAYFAEEDFVMHSETLHSATDAIWRRWGSDLCPKEYFLCGGTALALYLGHRQSDDLDFLTMTPGDPAVILTQLQTLDPATVLVDRSPHSLHVQIQHVKVSYLWQPGVRLDPGEDLAGIPLASIPTLTALKCNAVANRGSRKDFIDLYALIQHGISFAEILHAADEHAPNLNRAHLLRSLTYFADADAEPDPVLFRPWVWSEIKQTLTQTVHQYIRQNLPR